MSTSYSNPGGSGDRTNLIYTESYPSNLFAKGDLRNLINGASDSDAYFNTNSLSVVGAYMMFDFKVAKIIDEFTLVQSANTSHGIWNWQGSIDGKQWVTITSNITLKGITAIPVTGQVQAYRYYRLSGVSGTVSSGPWLYEFNFKTDETQIPLPFIVKTDINDISNIGEAIISRYTVSTAGSIGTFSELGITTANLIPTSVTTFTNTTIDGSFYWIYVGKDYLGRKKFIADRNIQNNITWQNLDSAGMINGAQITYDNISSYNFSKFFIRSMTGGISTTAIDNEWDQIIVNSNLNNTIIAGNNNVWNYYSIDSFTSTCYNSSTRVVRGGIYNTLSTMNSLNNFYYISVTTATASIGFRPVLLVEEPLIPIFKGNLLSDSVHTEDAMLTGYISNYGYKAQYQILVNNTQIYPDTGYTDLTITPISINYSISNSLLNLNKNEIKIIINNELNINNTYTFYATLYNNVPTGILTLSNTTTHTDNIELTGNITDSDLDKISYRILINGTERLMWNTFTTDPYIDYTILNKDLIIGNNVIEVDYKDNYKNVGLGSWNNTITKTNNSPIINVQYINGSLTGTITDPDSDLVQYRILVNGVQKYPETTEYSNLQQVCNINYQIDRSDILINQNNIITVFARDSLNTTIGQDISFMGDYVGLMFMDENKQFYTTDIGELLKYLDFGTITLGQITAPVKILVQNKYGFDIKDINLTINSTLPNISIEFSKENNPFIATGNLTLEKEYAINEIDYFYIRLNSSVSQDSTSGTFKIIAKAIPLN